MPNVARWSLSSTGLLTVLTTELNALGNNSISAASVTINNDSNLDRFVDIEVVLASLSPTGAAQILIYVAPSVDGSNFPTLSTADALLDTSMCIACIPVGTTAATAQRLVYRMARIPPTKFTVYFINEMGVNMGASGNTLRFLPYSIDNNAAA